MISTQSILGSTASQKTLTGCRPETSSAACTRPRSTSLIPASSRGEEEEEEEEEEEKEEEEDEGKRRKRRRQELEEEKGRK